MSAPIAAIPEPWGDETRYSLTDNHDAILAADQDKVIYVTTDDELLLELERRYPPPHERLSYLEVIENARYVGGTYTSAVEVAAHPRYTGKDKDELFALAKEHGPVKVTRFCPDFDARPAVLQPLGFLYNQQTNILSYDPKKAASRARTRAKKKAAMQVTTQEMFEVTNAAILLLHEHHLPIPDCSATDRHSVMHYLFHMMRVFNFAFGKHAHRKLPEFQAFLGLWKDRGAKTRELVTPAEQPTGMVWGLKVCDWLDKELKAKLPAATTKFEPIDCGIEYPTK